ncbi:hypothetical protein KO500_04080 [Cellulophaga baltica]|uniref:hypothetical protein n=1 Tax=Cellulophaga TaxID=104264 RepID=UPI001C0697A2|nr:MULTISPECIES: hypothetical protein [Cellulophaga]MBU2995593.1 hypothetical protein [Cellulophaga baltica]MDO6766987.1 hypothetical protein [Cellulophaga sp. 1_MG-2023]
MFTNRSPFFDQMNGIIKLSDVELEDLLLQDISNYYNDYPIQLSETVLSIVSNEKYIFILTKEAELYKLLKLNYEGVTESKREIKIDFKEDNIIDELSLSYKNDQLYWLLITDRFSQCITIDKIDISF